MEKPKGIDALKTLPFKDCVVDFDSALSNLTELAKTCSHQNTERFFNLVYDANQPELYAEIDKMKNNTRSAIDNFPPGGFATAKVDLRHIYDEFGDLTYSEVVDTIVTQAFPRFLGKPSHIRTPAAICLGYLTDLIEIGNTDISSREDRLKLVAKSLRDHEAQTQIGPFMVGMLVDDCQRFRSSTADSFDILVCIETVEDLETAYVNTLSKSDQTDYARGKDITVEQLQKLIDRRKQYRNN